MGLVRSSPFKSAIAVEEDVRSPLLGSESFFFIVKMDGLGGGVMI